MNKLILLLAVILASFIMKFSLAQNVLQQPIPFDPDVRYGVLENGMTYYIRHNAEPKERASFYIIQNVGALLEEDNQNGLAHFLEHMAFNGTQHFVDKGILNTLEKHGVAFGRNINAYTSFEETVYNLSDVPTTKPELLDTCLLILHDWSDYLLLTDKEINLERGVLNEEWRTRRNASFRMRSQWFPVLFKGAKYAIRDVIGDTAVILHHDPDVLRKFYHDWYRTDLQAVAIVGDFDVDQMEQKVKATLSEIKPIENPAPRPNFPIPAHDETYFVVATDKEAPQIQLSLYILSENKDGKEKTLADLREGYIRNLFNSMTGMRIEELLQKGTPPFVNGYTQISGFVRGYDTYIIGAVANPNEQAKALEAIMTETERVRRYGFTPGELERAKSNFLTNLESQYKQKDKIKNDTYARQCRDHYLTLEPMPGFDFEYQFAMQMVPGISIEEISAKAKEWIKPDNRTLVITGPTEGTTYLSEDEAKSIIKKVESMDIAPYVDALAAASLISDELKGSKVIKTTRLEPFDAVEWTLGNNVKVIFRHADYEKDQVNLKATSPGGSSLWDDQYVPSLDMTNSFIGAYGVGEFDAIALQKMLAGKKVSLSPGLSGLKEGLNGSSTPKDFETMLQLAYLFFEKPRFDQEAHDALMTRYMNYVVNIQKDPRKIMGDSLSNILANYHPRARNLDTRYLSEVSMDQIEKIYRDRFKDAGDFTFFIVGNLAEDSVKLLVEKYLGSLTDDPRTEKWIDRQIRSPKGETNKKITIAMATPKANVNVFFEKEIPFTAKNNLMMNIFDGILDLRYTETVREDEGGTYGVSVNGSLSKFPVEDATLKISFDCDPVKADHLKSIIYREIDKIIAEGPTEVDFDKTIKNLLKDREQAREHNSFWMNSLYNYYDLGINFADSTNYEVLLNSMTREDIRQFVSLFFDKKNTVDVVFVPQQ